MSNLSKNHQTNNVSVVILDSTSQLPLIPALIASLHNQQDTRVLLLKFIILTGARLGEALGATWDEIDLDANTWTITANRMKTRKTHVVPLSSQTRTLIEQLPRSSSCSFLFLKNNERPFTNLDISIFWGRLGYSQNVKIQDLRATFRRWCEGTSFTPSTINSMEDITYLRRGLTSPRERRELIQAWANFLDPSFANERKSALICTLDDHGQYLDYSIKP